MSKLIDLTNQNFGYWHVIERAENDPRGQAQWKCICTACGKEKVVKGGHLRGGRSTNCGCVRMKKMREAIIKNEEGKTYGYLKVMRRAKDDEKPRNNRFGVYWICNCTKCGRENIVVLGDYLRNGDTQSCGCMISKNESIIATMLSNLKISFKKQWYFQDLKLNVSGDYPKFDFAVFNNEQLLYLIEYDGQQHFDKNHAWSEEQYKKTRQNDLLKNEYCFKNNIPLIRIPYNKEYTISDLQLSTTRFLLTPQNEGQYYLNCES